MAVRAEVGKAERSYFHLPRVTFVGDREAVNLLTSLEFISKHPDIYSIGGVVGTGGELDAIIPRVVGGMPRLRHPMRVPTVRGDAMRGSDWTFVGEGHEFRYYHAEYDAKKLTREADYRRWYCEKVLGEALQGTQPDLVLLSNFKVFLDPLIVAMYPDLIINVHPSVLPLLKGYRPEYEAGIKGRHPEAYGYAVHFVADDLDGGDVIINQEVQPVEHNQEVLDHLGKEKYNLRREEQLRLKVILAESDWIPQILALALSRRAQKVVRGHEAFEAEGRAGFERSDAYIQSLLEEYGVFQKRGGQEDYAGWFKNVHKDYARRLFVEKGEFITAETLLGVPKRSEIATPDPLTLYSFRVPQNNRVASAFFENLDRAGNAMQNARKTGRIHFIGRDENDYSEISVLASINLTRVLKLFGIHYNAQPLPTYVKSERVPIEEFIVPEYFAPS